MPTQVSRKCEVLQRNFREAARRSKIDPADYRRFRVHCLQYDLEALLLAAPDALRKRLDTQDKLTDNWCLPVERQNNAKPPKKVVENLFRRYKKRDYQDTSDAPWILREANLDQICEACPTRFGAWVHEIKGIISGKPPDA